MKDINTVTITKPGLDYDRLEIPNKEEDILYSDPQEVGKQTPSRDEKLNYIHPSKVS